MVSGPRLVGVKSPWSAGLGFFGSLRGSQTLTCLRWGGLCKAKTPALQVSLLHS
jgi:hypothetical protein